MITPSHPHWLFDFWRRHRAADDAAEDLGTAFGLELSMIPEDDEPPKSSSRSGSSGGGRAGWLRRLMRRRQD